MKLRFEGTTCELHIAQNTLFRHRATQETCASDSRFEKALNLPLLWDSERTVTLRAEDCQFCILLILQGYLQILFEEESKFLTRDVLKTNSITLSIDIFEDVFASKKH